MGGDNENILENVEAQLASMHGIQDGGNVSSDCPRSFGIEGDPPEPPDRVDLSCSKEESTSGELEKVFGEGATQLAITFEESSKGKRFREDKRSISEGLTGNISDMESNLVESKKVKLGVEPTLSVELSSNGSSQIASVKDATSSGKEKTEQLAPSGDI